MAELLTPEELAQFRLDCEVIYVPHATWRLRKLLTHIDALNASIPARERSAFLKGAKWADVADEVWDKLPEYQDPSAEAARCYPDSEAPSG